jgi:DNA-directed RNA polymerase specialized sigma24 family protein
MHVIGTQRGLSRRQKAALVKRRLAVLLRRPERIYRLNLGHATDLGLAYSEKAIEAGELLCALGRCTPRQQRIVLLWLGPRRLRQARIAREMGLSVATVKREAAAAVRGMAAQAWEE